MVRREIGDYPADRTDSSSVYFDMGTGVSDTGLPPSTEYYYKAWSEGTGSQQWSNAFAVISPSIVGIASRIRKRCVA
ncbi:hypothetical protein ACFLXZ_00085 [Chloroflexota bacterium]